jgi:hypothetical protein
VVFVVEGGARDVLVGMPAVEVIVARADPGDRWPVDRDELHPPRAPLVVANPAAVMRAPILRRRRSCKPENL